MPKWQRFRGSKKHKRAKGSAGQEPLTDTADMRVVVERKDSDIESSVAPTTEDHPEHALFISDVTSVPARLVGRLQKLPELAESCLDLLFTTELGDDGRISGANYQLTLPQFNFRNCWFNFFEKVGLEVVAESPRKLNVINRFALAELFCDDELADGGKRDRADELEKLFGFAFHDFYSPLFGCFYRYAVQAQSSDFATAEKSQIQAVFCCGEPFKELPENIACLNYFVNLMWGNYSQTRVELSP